MLVDLTQAVDGYLHDVFVGNMNWGILIGYVAQISAGRNRCSASK